jgi:hypothetical protein
VSGTLGALVQGAVVQGAGVQGAGVQWAGVQGAGVADLHVECAVTELAVRHCNLRLGREKWSHGAHYMSHTCCNEAPALISKAQTPSWLWGVTVWD